MSSFFHSDAYQIGKILFSPSEAAFLINGEKRKLRPREALLLTELIKSHPDPLTRDEMVRFVWGDTYATPQTINQTVKSLRDHLEDKDKDIIKTIPQKGYILSYEPLLIPQNVDVARQNKETNKPSSFIDFLCADWTAKHLIILALSQLVLGIIFWQVFSYLKFDYHRYDVGTTSFLFTPNQEETKQFVNNDNNLSRYIIRYDNFYTICDYDYNQDHLSCQNVSR